MKASVNNWNIELDNEAIKAIRFVNGFNPDLRVKLAGAEDTLWHYLDGNYVNLFGLDAKPDATAPEWDRWERMLNRAVRKIMEVR